jgi:hypothetical protein
VVPASSLRLKKVLALGRTKVYGLWFDYETIRAKLQWIHAEMYRRYPLMEQGETFEITNFVVDEWRTHQYQRQGNQRT